MKFILLHQAREKEDIEVVVNVATIEYMQYQSINNYTKVVLTESVLRVQESIAEIIELINA